MVASGVDADVGEGEDAKRLSTDRIYELMCFFWIVGKLCASASRWKLIRGQGLHGYRLPYAPGNKQNFAFFRFAFDGEALDLCCGVEIDVQNEPPEAPDITLQQCSDFDNDDRSVGPILGIWEAKYHGGRNKLVRTDVSQMLSRCDVLRPPRCAGGDALDRFMPEPFKVHAVVSNSPHASFNRQQRLDWCFSIVFQFDGTSTAVVEPTRAEHLAFGGHRHAT